MAWPFSVDLSQNYLAWVNTITIQFLSKTEEAPPLAVSGAGVQITNVLWTEIRKDKLSADSPLMEYDRTFRIAKAVAEGIVPKENDIIIDDLGLRWKVELVEVLTYGTEYRVHTTKSGKQGLPVG